MVSTATRCGVFGCDRPAVAVGLCDMHYRRKRRHGHLEQTRPNDWGERHSHPLYGYWSQVRRNGMPLVEEWHTDFWAFVRDVGERPSKKHTLFRPDKSRPMGQDNAIWAESKGGDARNSEHANKRLAGKTWQAEYQARRRAADPFHDLRQGLKVTHGITLEDYERMLDAQNSVCAICGRQEHRISSSNQKRMRLAVDHDHQTATIRGLLCSMCNHAIGYLDDSPVLLLRAIEYLRDPPAVVLGIKHNGKAKVRRVERPASPFVCDDGSV